MRTRTRTRVGLLVAGAGVAAGSIVASVQPAEAALLPTLPTLPIPNIQGLDVNASLAYYTYAINVCTDAALADPANAAQYLLTPLTGVVSPFGECVHGGPL